jgi:AcrR family transcriptional regulator
MAAPAGAAVGPGDGGRGKQVPPPGGRSKLSPELLARAAIEIADTDGLAAVSMRRLATSLGVGTMTLYYHVRDKDELLDLMWDEFMGEHLLDEVPAGWRAALTEIAQCTRESYQRHPWALHVVARPARGPNKLRHMEQYLTVVSRITDDQDEQLRILHSVSDLVVGCTLRELGSRAFRPPAGSPPAGSPADGSPADGRDGAVPVVQPQPDFGVLTAAEDLPRVRSLWSSGCLVRAPRFEHALGWLLDGIEAAHSDAGRRAAALTGPAGGKLVGVASAPRMLSK